MSIISIILSLVLCFSSLGALVPSRGEWFGECTTLIAQGTAAKNGGLILAKNRDQSYLTPSSVLTQPRLTHEKDETVQTVTIAIPQVGETWAFTGSGSAGAFGVSFGVNEHRVAVACNDANSRDNLSYDAGLSDNDVVRLTLERAQTAKEGMEIIAALTETYGQAYHGECYEIGDPDEVWVIETTGKRWAAKRYVDCFVARANQFELCDDYDLCSDDLVAFAEQMGWAKADANGKINFRKAYGGDCLDAPADVKAEDRTGSETLYECEMRYQRCMEMLAKAIKENGAVSMADMTGFLRDHYDQYTLPSGQVIDMNQIPFYASEYGKTHAREEIFAQPTGDTQEVPLFVRSICSHRLIAGATTAGGVIRADRNSPAMMLACIGTPCTGLFTPFFPVQSQTSAHYATAKTANIANATSMMLLTTYEPIIKMIQGATQPWEGKMLAEVETLEADTSVERLTDLSESYAEAAFALTNGMHEKLLQFLEQYFATHRS